LWNEDLGQTLDLLEEEGMAESRNTQSRMLQVLFRDSPNPHCPTHSFTILMYLIHVSMFLFVLSFEEHDLMPIVMMQGESRVNWFRRKKRHLHDVRRIPRPARDLGMAE
jgi:hypothetical protein